MVCHQVELAFQPANLSVTLRFQRVIGFVYHLFLIRLAHQLRDLLPGQHLELIFRRVDLPAQHILRLFALVDLRLFIADGRFQRVDHVRAALLHLLDVHFQNAVQKVHPRMMRRAALASAPMIRSAGICRIKLLAAHGEHRTAAVPAEQQPGIRRFVLADAVVVAARPLLHLLLHIGERRIVDNRFVMVFKDKLLGFVDSLVLSVDALAPVLALSKRSDIKIVAEHSLYCHNRPRILALPDDRLAAFRLSRGFGTSGRRYAVVGQIIRNPLIAPARRIQFKNLSDNPRCRRVDFIRHQLVVLHDISIRHGTDPASILLSPGNDAFDFLRRIRDRHFIEQKTQADICPIVVRRIINAVPDGYNPHARVPQIL